MKKDIKTFSDYMSDESRVTPADRERINFEASLIEDRINNNVRNIEDSKVNLSDNYVYAVKMKRNDEKKIPVLGREKMEEFKKAISKYSHKK